VEFQLCEWVITGSFSINDINISESVVTLIVSPAPATPHSFWRNESGIFIRSTNWLNMEKSPFNYSCGVTNPKPNYGTHFQFTDMDDISGKPLLDFCASLIKLPAHLISAGIDFYKSLITVHSTESNSHGVKSDGPGCMIKVEEDYTKFLW
jgi:hypothetical protein